MFFSEIENSLPPRLPSQILSCQIKAVGTDMLGFSVKKTDQYTVYIS